MYYGSRSQYTPMHELHIAMLVDVIVRWPLLCSYHEQEKELESVHDDNNSLKDELANLTSQQTITVEVCVRYVYVRVSLADLTWRC